MGASSRLRAATRDGDQFAEGLRVTDRQIREHLAIDVHAGQLEAVHELVVGHPLAACGRVDPGDPELAHVALPCPPVAVGVLERVEHRLVRRPEERPVGHPEALGEAEDLLVAAAGRDAAFYTWHLRPGPSCRGRPGAGAWRPCRSIPAACCTAASGAGSCGQAGGSSARAAARSCRSWSCGTALPTRDVYEVSAFDRSSNSSAPGLEAGAEP